MSARAMLLACLAAAFVLAGCTSPPAEDEGEKTPTPVTGEASFTYTPEVRPTPAEVGGQPNPVQDAACAPDAVPAGTCQDAHTTVAVMLHTAPAPPADGYTAFLVGAEGEREVGPLVADDQGMYSVTADFPGEDLTGQYDTLEIRSGSTVLATASTAAGVQPLQVATEAPAA